MQLRIKWLSILLLSLAILVVTHSQATGPKDPHLMIYVYRYAGHEHSDAFNKFYTILAWRTRQLFSLLGSSEDISYLQRLVISKPKDHAPTELVKLDLVWREKRALALLNGLIFENQDGARITSTMYLGDLADYKNFLPKKELVVTTRIHEQYYNDLFDSHSAVILYVLAIDALRSKDATSDIILKYLSKAKNFLAKLESSDQRTDDLLLLRTAIDKAEIAANAKASKFKNNNVQ